MVDSTFEMSVLCTGSWGPRHLKTCLCWQKCNEIIVMHLGYLNYTQYTVVVGFEHLKRQVKEMNFTVST